MLTRYKIRTMRNEWHGYNAARLEISVGQPYHEGEKFLTLADWVQRHFKSATVNVCDSLQRHNLRLTGLSPFNALVKSMELGDEWIKRNGRALAILPALKIVRWDEWKKEKEWDEGLEASIYAYRHDPNFSKLIDTKAIDFWERRSERDNLPASLKENFLTSSKNYMLEEIAVGVVMAKDKTVADIYPGTILQAFDYFRDAGLPAPISMTTVGFAKRKEEISLAS